MQRVEEEYDDDVCDDFDEYLEVEMQDGTTLYIPYDFLTAICELFHHNIVIRPDQQLH